MANTKQRRMALTLTPELERVLTAFGEALGRPASSLTVEMLVELIPQFEGLTKVANAARAGNRAAAKRAVAHMLGDNMAQAMAAQQPELFGKPRRK